MRRLITFVLIVLGGLALTVSMGGVWRWMERILSVRILGENGPAMWCYVVVWGLLAVFFWPRRR